FYVNHLATDSENNRLLYTGITWTPQDPLNRVTHFFSYDLTTGTRTTLSPPPSNLVGTSYGGGGFYDGAYYMFDDNGGQQGIVRATFNPDGSVASWDKPFGNHTLGNGLGDMAIDAEGLMYIYTD